MASGRMGDDDGEDWEKIGGKDGRKRTGSLDETQGANKMQKVGSVQEQKQDKFKVLIKCREGQSGFRSINPLKLTDDLQKALGDIHHARVLADSKLLVVFKDSGQ